MRPCVLPEVAPDRKVTATLVFAGPETSATERVEGLVGHVLPRANCPTLNPPVGVDQVQRGRQCTARTRYR